ncbi:RRXRR domain-containing protein [Microcoleus vaginatus]|uniref:RRXRR domain-containing protein n=1 Tax=Microcoleus vaginatus TaxID=119532 RepID=UPI004040C2FE
MRVFVLDKNLKPLDPCHRARAIELLDKGSTANAFKLYVNRIWYIGEELLST